MSMTVNNYRHICQKNKEENYFFDRFFFRKISIYFTIIFIKLKIKANQATFLSLVAALAACYFLMFNTPVMMAVAVICIFLYHMLDHVDGELARYHISRGQQEPSLKGQYFDVLIHKYSTNLFLFFLGVSVYNMYGYTFAVYLGFAACIGMSAFPNLLASQVILQKIGGNKQVVDDDEHVSDILYLLEKKQEQISKLRSGNMTQKARKIITELLFFPGCLILIMLVLIFDMLIGGFTLFSYEVNMRLLFLMGATPVYLVNALRQTRNWMRKFEKV